MAGENEQQRIKLGRTYGLALYELAQAAGQIDDVRRQLATWKIVVKQQPVLVRYFNSVIVKSEDRQKFLEQFAGEMSGLMMNFLGVMNRRNRLGVLPEVIDAFEDEDDRQNNRQRVKLTTAVEVDAHLMQDICNILREYLLKEPIIEHKINPAIIGGFTAHAGDTLIDGSVKTRLELLEKALRKRGEDEIQSRRDFIGN